MLWAILHTSWGVPVVVFRDMQQNGPWKNNNEATNLRYDVSDILSIPILQAYYNVR